MQKYVRTLYKNTNNTKRQAQNQISKYELIKKHHKFLRDSQSSQSSQSQSLDSQQEQKKIKKQHKQQQIKLKDNSVKNRQIYHVKQQEKKQIQNSQTAQKLAKQYYKNLYKQFALVDLSRYQSGMIGCRWRTQKQVLKLKGQKICGSLKCNSQVKNVYEMNFKYEQNGQIKNALVKVSACKQCGEKLNFKKKLKQIGAKQSNRQIQKQKQNHIQRQKQRQRQRDYLKVKKQQQY